MGLFRHDQFYAAIESTVDIQVAGRRQDIELGCIADLSPDRIGHAISQIGSQIENESTVSAPVFPDMPAVHNQIGHRTGTAETDINPLSFPTFRDLQLLHVVTYATEVVLFSIQCIGTPRVGQIHRLSMIATPFILIEETPSVVNIDNLSCTELQPEHQRQNPNSYPYHSHRSLEQI